MQHVKKPALFAATVTLASFAATATLASSLMVDRGLPNANLNNDAGSDRSNVSWGFNGDYASGDTFSLGTNGVSYQVDKLSVWITAGAPGGQLEDRLKDLSLYVGSDTTADAALTKMKSTTITGNASSNADVQISQVTYPGGEDYQGSSGSYIQIYQVDFLNLGILKGDDYVFSVWGDPTDGSYPTFLHASNAGLGGVTADGSDDLYSWLYFNGSDRSEVYYGGAVDSNGYGWDKSSDINIQVYATEVPIPASLPLLALALGGGALVSRRRR
ncbi:MAG: hypothetical protein ACU0DK_03165 [Pseudooceanicola sp.]